MTRLLVDTGAWFAAADDKDPDHPAVARCLREWSGRLVVTNFIVDETVTLLRYRLGFDPARRFGERIIGGEVARLVAVTRRDEKRAWDIFTRYRDKRFSYTDCTSFAAMQRLGIDTAIAIDDDFRSFGVTCLP